MLGWRSDLNQGMRLLSRHNAGAALKAFCRALQQCPVQRGAELSRLLFFMGIALKRLGFSGSAIRSWTASQRLKKGAKAKKMLQRFCNGYGMPKQICEEQDDWNAFYSIQLRRYLRLFNRRSLAHAREGEVLRQILSAYWEKLRKYYNLEGRSAAEKSAIFRKYPVDFPLFLDVPPCESLLSVDFHTGRKKGLDARCPCGSGLLFFLCCGRSPGIEELENGFY